MALVLDDRVKETSTTTGTGTLNLSGAVSGFQTFVAGVGDGNTTYYAIVNRDADEWEVGLGTVTDSSTDTLSRSAITSSNSDSAVDFSAGTKDVFVTLPASKVANLDTNNNLSTAFGSRSDGKIKLDYRIFNYTLTDTDDWEITGKDASVGTDQGIGEDVISDFEVDFTLSAVNIAAIDEIYEKFYIYWKATDSAGNISYTKQEVRITDNTAPILTVYDVSGYAESNSNIKELTIPLPVLTDNLSNAFD